jgi:hypothetical protein
MDVNEAGEILKEWDEKNPRTKAPKDGVVLPLALGPKAWIAKGFIEGWDSREAEIQELKKNQFQCPDCAWRNTK